MQRTKEDIENRLYKIRSTTPDVLELFFEQQNRLCDLCSRPIQDLIFAHLDHSVPAILFAIGPLGLEEAAKEANDLSNLRVTHDSCNLIKNRKTRDEWFACRLNEKVGDLKIYTPVEIEELRKVQFNLRSTWQLGIHPDIRSNRGRKRAETLGKEGLYLSGKRRAETLGFSRLSEIIKKGNLTLGIEGKKAATAKMNETLGPEGRSARSAKRIFNMSSERKFEIARKGAVTRKMNGTDQPSEETRKKMREIRNTPEFKAAKSAQVKEWWSNPENKARMLISFSLRNKEVTEETRKKMSMASTGRIKSIETRTKLSAALRGQRRSEETKKGMRGRKVSALGIQNMRDAATLRVSSTESRNKISEGVKKYFEQQFIKSVAWG